MRQFKVEMTEPAGRMPLPPRPPRYRVSRSPDGAVLWWDEWETIPPDHTVIRFATDQEVLAIMRLSVLARGRRPVPQRLKDEFRDMAMELSDG